MLPTRASRAPRPHRRAALVGGAVLTTGLLLGGCSGDDEPPAKADASETSEGSTAAATLIQTGLDQMEAGEVDAARGTFENALAVDPENVFALYNLGVISQSAGADDQALDLYDRALVNQTDYAPALFNKAIILETSDLDQSIQLYRQAIASDDQLAAAHMRLGFALVHQDKVEEGEKFLEQGIALDPTMTEVEAPFYN